MNTNQQKTEISNKKCFVCRGCSKVFANEIKKLGLVETNRRQSCDIACIGEYAEKIPRTNALIAFCPEDIGVSGLNCICTVSAGMGSKATLGFSSVGDGFAMLSICREIDFFGKKVIQGDYKVEIKPDLSLYESIIFGFLNLFL